MAEVEVRCIVSCDRDPNWHGFIKYTTTYHGYAWTGDVDHHGEHSFQCPYCGKRVVFAIYPGLKIRDAFRCEWNDMGRAHWVLFAALPCFALMRFVGPTWADFLLGTVGVLAMVMDVMFVYESLKNTTLVIIRRGGSHELRWDSHVSVPPHEWPHIEKRVRCYPPDPKQTLDGRLT